MRRVQDVNDAELWAGDLELHYRPHPNYGCNHANRMYLASVALSAHCCTKLKYTNELTIPLNAIFRAIWYRLAVI